MLTTSELIRSFKFYCAHLLVLLLASCNYSFEKRVVPEKDELTVNIFKSVTETIGSCAFVNTPSSTNSLSSLSFKVVFSDSIDTSTFTSSDILNTGTTATSGWNIDNCGDNKTYKVTAIGLAGDGSIEPSLPGGSVRGSSGKENKESPLKPMVIYDTTPPSVSIEAAVNEAIGSCLFLQNSDPTNVSGFSYRIEFSEEVNPGTFSVSDIVNHGTGGSGLLNWALESCSDNRNYRLVVNTINGDGTVIPELAANLVEDRAGNLNLASTSVDNSVSYITTAPDVAINQATTETVGTCSFSASGDPRNTAGFSYRVTFSKAINASTFTVSDITNAGTGGGTTLSWNLENCGDDTNFKLTASAVSGNGTIVPVISSNKVQDSAGNYNTNSTATDNSITFDDTSLGATINQAITETVGSCSFTAATDPTNTSGFSYKVTFSQAINAGTFSSSDIVNAGTGGATTLVWALSDCGDGIHFKITATSVSGVGTIIPTIPANAVQDFAGNDNLASTATDNSILFDNVSPTVTINQATTESVGSCNFTAANDPTNTAGFSYKIAFSEAINTSTISTSDINNSGTGGGTSLTWTLTNCGDDTHFMLTASAVNGDGTIRPSLNAGVVQDKAGNTSSASTSTDNTVTLLSSKFGAVINQAITETVGSCSFTAVNDPVNAAGFSYKISFTRSIETSTLTSGDILNSGAGGGTTLSWSLSNCGDDQNFKLTASSVSGDGTIIPYLAADSVKDKIGNDNTASTATDNSVIYDSVRPTLTINQAVAETVGSCTFTAVTDPTQSSGFSYRVRFSEAIDTGTFTVSDIVNSGTGGGTTLVWSLADCGDATNFKITATTVSGAGTIIPEIAANAVQDPAGNNNFASTATDNSVLFDNTSPSVAINQSTLESVGSCNFTAATDPTNTAGFSYKISFSEPINAASLSTSDFTNSGTGGGTTLTWILSNCGDDTNFMLTASAISGDGTIIPSLNAGTVQDKAGNNNSASTSSDNTVTFLSSKFGATVNQAVTETVGTCSFTAVNDPANATGFSYKISFSRPIETSTFTLSDILNSGTGGGTTLTWSLANCGDDQNFKLTASAITGDGTIIPHLAVDTVKDKIGNDNTASTATDNSVTLDTVQPTLTINQSVAESVGTCSFTQAKDPSGVLPLSFRITFSESINPASFTVSDIINGGTGGGTTLTWLITSCGDNTNFNLSATAITGYGTIVPSVAAGSVQDSAGNTNLVSTSTDNSVNYIETGWVQEAYIKASNSGQYDYFGYAVSLSGETLAVGAYGEDSTTTAIINGATSPTDNTRNDSGAVYVYKRSGTTWVQEAYIKAANATSSDNFGELVDLNRDTLVVGAKGEDSYTTTVTTAPTFTSNDFSNSTGAVYVYKRTGSNWEHEAYAKAVNSVSYLRFGAALSVSGDTIAVGAPDEGNNQTVITNGTTAATGGGLSSSGAVYIYRIAGANWVQEAYIKASNANISDSFGASISLQNDTLVVGSYQDDSNLSTITNGADSSEDNSSLGSGAVYVYRRTNGSWIQEAYIKASNNNADDRFGYSVSVSGDTLAASAYMEDSNVTSITNGTTASGNNGCLNCGAVYIYKRTGYTWIQEAFIKPSNVGVDDYFGYSVALSGNYLAVGANQEDGNQTTITNGSTFTANELSSNSGAVYMFKRTGSLWEQDAFIKASNNTSSDFFGSHIFLNGDTLVVGVHQEDSNESIITNGSTASSNNTSLDSGAVYVYRNLGRLSDPGDFILTAKTSSSLNLSWTSAGPLATGYKLAYSSGINPPADCSSGTVIDTGNVLSYNVTGLANGFYSFRICAYNSSETSEGLTSTFHTSSMTPEVASFIATVTAIQINLSWTSGGGATTGYQIAYQPGKTPPSSCTSGTVINAGNVLTYQVTGLNARTDYSFRICSYDASSNLSYGKYLVTTTDYTPEVSWIGISGTTSSAFVNWTGAGGGTNGFRLAWALGNTAPATCLAGTNLDVGNVSSYEITGLSAGQQIAARVCSYQISGADLSPGTAILGTTITSGWNQEAYIKAFNSDAGDFFGYSVSLSGDTLAVGSYLEDSSAMIITNGTTATVDNLKTDSGAVYVYKRTGTNWQQQAFIKAVNSGATDNFGISVSLDKDTLAVGAKNEDSGLTTITNGSTIVNSESMSDSGAVYIYKRSGVSWNQEAYIKTVNNGWFRYNVYFGTGVSLSGDSIAVSSPQDTSDDNTITNGPTASISDNWTNVGSVYVYKRTGTTWAQEAYIKASNADSNDFFGSAISLNGDTLAVGVTSEDSNTTTIINGVGTNHNETGSNSGAVYIYRRTNGLWIQEAFVKAVNSNMSDNFGVSVSVSGDTLAAGADLEDSLQTTITNGASASTLNDGSNNGAVYVYKRTPAGWAQEAFVKAPNNGSADSFGSHISLNGHTLAVGARNEDSNQTTITNGAAVTTNDSISNSGAVYVFKRTGLNWAFEAYLKASSSDIDDLFGSAVSLNGDTIAVGAYQEDSNQSVITNGTSGSLNNSSINSGAVYIYRNNARLFEPSDFTYTGRTSNSITLSWASAGLAATGYRIAYAIGTTPPADCSSGVTIDAGNVDSYNVTGLTLGEQYSFRICSYDSLGSLSEGYTATFQTAPASPEITSLTATVNSSSQVTLTWASGGGATAGFQIAYQAGLTPPANCASGTVIDAGNVLTRQVTGLLATTTYAFRVCSYDASHNLSFGRYVSARTINTPEVTWIGVSGTPSTAVVNWTSGGGATTGFRLAWATGATPPATCLAGTNLDVGNITNYTVTGLTAGQQVAVRICSYQISGSDLSSGRTITGSSITTGWNQEAFIKASNNDLNDQFGSSISINGETLVVGALYEDGSDITITNGNTASASNGKTDSGAVYVYRRLGSMWSQEAYIKANNSGTSDYFGQSVSVHGETLVVGAKDEDSNLTSITNGPTIPVDNNSGNNNGAAYVYRRTGTTWVQEAYLKAANTMSYDCFGNAVSLSGDTIAVGAHCEDSTQSTITNGTTASTVFGSSLSGAVYIYKRTGSTWAQEAYIKASNRDSADYFGQFLELHEDTLVVGAWGESSNVTIITNGATAGSADNSAYRSGAVYVYRRTGTTWAQEAYIKAANSAANDYFGYSLSINGDTLAVGAYGEDSNDTVITSGTTASGNNTNTDSGAVYIYKRNGTIWAQEAFVKAANNGSSDNFGNSVSLSGNTLVVGSYIEDSIQTTITNGTTAASDNSMSDSGAVYVYKRTGTIWAQEAYIKPSSSTSLDKFGYSVTLSGDTIAVGSPMEDSNHTVITNGTSGSMDNSIAESGAVYVFRNNARLFNVTDVWATSDSSSVTLRWNRTGGIAIGYVITYQPGTTAPADCNSGTFQDAGNTSQDIISGLSPATTYSFRVCSAQDASTFSEGKTITVTTAP